MSKQKSGKRIVRHLMEITIPDLKISKSGNSYYIFIPSRYLEKYNLEVGTRVRPLLCIPSPELKTKLVRYVPFKILPLSRTGNSVGLRIPMYIFKRYRLKHDMQVLFLILIIKIEYHTNELSYDDVLVIKDGVPNKIKKSEYIKMEYLYNIDQD